MTSSEEFRRRARETWAAGDWDGFSRLIEPVGALVLERVGVEPGTDLLDVGTGSGGTVAIPAALLGAKVVGADVTPELLGHARRRAAEAGVDVTWIEADAQELPFEDASFDRVISTFGAMFAPDHARAAAELVRVCRPDGRIVMTTWAAAGFAGELFKLMGRFLPPPPGVQPPALWGSEAHVLEVFASAGAIARITRETATFEFASVEEAVRKYAADFGPFVMARAALEPEGRWEEFAGAYTRLFERFNAGAGGKARLESEYFIIGIDR